MRRYRTISGTVLLLVCSLLNIERGLLPASHVRAAEGDHWIEFTPAEEDFTVLMPMKPQSFVHRYGDTSVTMCAYTVEANGVSFVVSSMGDMPERLTQNPDAVARFFERLPANLIASAKQAGNGDLLLIEQRDIRTAAIEGRYYRLGSQSYVGEVNAYRKGRRFYTVAIVGPKDKVRASAVNKFLNSFRFL